MENFGIPIMLKFPISHFSTNLNKLKYWNAGIPTVIETSNFA